LDSALLRWKSFATTNSFSEKMTDPNSVAPFGSDASSSEWTSISFVDFLVFVVKHRSLLISFPLLALVAATIIALLLPNWYTAAARMLPPQQSQTNAVAILGQLGALAGGAAQSLGVKNPNDIYIAMLKSNAVADSLIERFNLKAVYGEERLIDTRKELARNSMIYSTREGVITIEVEDQDPDRAAHMANAYIEELRNLTVRLAVSEASQRRLFFEIQVKKVKDDLTNAEHNLKAFAQKAGLVSPEGQVGLTVAAAAALRAQITAKEVQLSAVRTFATDSNPDVQRITHEIAGLRAELAKMEKNTNVERGDVIVPMGAATEIGLEYIRKYRDVKYYETLYGALARQLEIAKIDEAKDATLIQVLDAALPPEVKSKPRRFLIIAISTIVAGVLALVAIVLWELYGRVSQDPTFRAQLDRLRS
jgi:uncharacterized protein involved in exopolysaccharide biosynthesis